MSSSVVVECLVDFQAELGEGPCWHAQEQVLYWLDINGKKVHRFDPATGENTTRAVSGRPGTIAPRANGELLLAMESDIQSLNFATGAVTMLSAEVEAGERTRFNDGKCDPKGRFWFGSLDLEESAPVGNFYRMNADHSIDHQLDQIQCSNGLAWDCERGRMYYIDSSPQKVYVFDYDNESGVISNQQLLIQFTEEMGYPDGMCLDRDGNLWIAQWGAGGVSQFDPKGKFLQKIDIPTAQVSCCAFGGLDLNQLYVTTASVAMSVQGKRENGNAGKLFRIDLGDIQGQAAYTFAG